MNATQKDMKRVLNEKCSIFGLKPEDEEGFYSMLENLAKNGNRMIVSDIYTKARLYGSTHISFNECSIRFQRK